MSGRARSIALRATILSILAGPAMAQESPQPGAALEEVIVTAQKREQSSQDVAISIQAISAEALQKLGATQVTDLARSAPSLSLGGVAGSQQSMGLRGVVDFSRNIGIDARMGTYIDGVFQGRSSTANQPLAGVQSVEILRGPQGTLFGMNTVSGAISINTRKASDEFSGQLSGGIGNEGYWTGSVYLNGPLSDKVFGYIAYTHQERDGWYRDPYTRGVGDWSQDGVRGQLRWLATDQLEVILAGDYGKTDSNGPIYTKFADPAYYTEKGPESDDVDRRNCASSRPLGTASTGSPACTTSTARSRPVATSISAHLSCRPLRWQARSRSRALSIRRAMRPTSTLTIASPTSWNSRPAFATRTSRRNSISNRSVLPMTLRLRPRSSLRSVGRRPRRLSSDRRSPVHCSAPST